MSADVDLCREAAALMRKRARAAIDAAQDVWWQDPEDEFDGLVRVLGRLEDAEEAMADARHIASWSPAVALDVANWLDAVAERGHYGTCELEVTRFRHTCSCPTQFAKGVASAYLGRPA